MSPPGLLTRSKLRGEVLINLRISTWARFATLALACASCRPGVCSANDVQPSATPYDLNDRTEPWQSSKSGITTRVMEPYTPLVLRANQVNCWGRTYALDGLFPTAIVSKSQDILAKPISLKIKIGNRWITLQAKANTFSRLAPDRIDFESTATIDSITVGSRSWIEYDGFIRTDLTLATERAVTIEALSLEFTFSPEASIFYHAEKRWTANIFQRSPTEPGSKITYQWLPLVWVGNHDVGLTVVTETWDGWSSPHKAIELQRNAQDLSLNLAIITKPTVFQGQQTYQFGLLATPAKPMRKDHWSIRVGTQPGVNLFTTMSGGWSQPLFSFPQPGDFNKMSRLLTLSHQQGLRFCYYITTSATSAQSEVNKRHHDEWLMSKEIFKSDEWSSQEGGVVGVDACCPSSGFSDFMAWSVEQAMNNMDIDGIYIDNPGPYWCKNNRHGCGKGGKRTYPYFAVRDLHKRIYTIVKTKKPDGFIWEHTSRTFNPLQLAWIDVYSDGEPYRNANAWPKEKLSKTLNRTYFEISGTGQQVGAVPCFLSSMGVRPDGDWSYWLASRVLPWGQLPWVQHKWMDGTAVIAASRARMDFGLGKEPITFYRPHELPSWLDIKVKPATSEENLIVSLWQRQCDKAVLVILANWTEESIQASIDEKKLTAVLGPCAYKDAMSNLVLPGRLAVSIPANSFRMVTIEPKVYD